ncbi:MAG: hypothetical protein COS84_02310 [Armatimonadetes bacterium CG07_land_8_20_14_0_80_40_9]|nr:MAG: hypothetical protein COS84_02310 [Armatimonadetes bacterium CG07_land_8_20_14_0_80_40_9]
MQEQFAQKVGVTFPTINNWERGNRTPHPFLFQRLMEMAEEAGLKNIEDIHPVKYRRLSHGVKRPRK